MLTPISTRFYIVSYVDINISINSRNIVAGTSEDRVKEEIKAAKKILNI